MAEEDLSDEQLHQLLKDAEQRLTNVQRTKEVQPFQTSLSSLQKSISKVTSEKPIASYIQTTTNGAHVDPSHLVSEQDRTLANGVRVVEDPVAIKIKAAQDKKSTAGSSWYNMPRTVVTPELKRDLQLLQMRGVLDSKRHYKKDSTRAEIPEFSQIGTIIQGPTEFFTARLTNKERKRTFLEGELAKESTTGKFRKDYGKIQAAKTSGKKEHYKALRAKRSSGRVSKG